MANIIKDPTIFVKCSKPSKQDIDSITCMAVESNTKYFPINMIWVYKNKSNLSNEEFMPIAALRSTLADTLNHFPILSGRITDDSNGNATIHLTNEGVAFTAAHCPDQRLDFFLLRTKDDYEGEFDYVNINASDLRVPVANGFTGPMVSIQVTRTQCGSILITLSAFHCLMDAQSSADFMNAWAEGGQTVTKSPYFDKSFVLLSDEERNSYGSITRPSDCVFTRSTDPLPLTPFVTNQQQRVVSRVYHFSEDELKHIKEAAMKDLPSHIDYISTYDALYAHLILVIASATQSSFEHEHRMKVLQSLNGRPIFATSSSSEILNYFGSFPFWLYGEIPKDPTPPTLSSLAAFIHHMHSKQTRQSLKYYNAFLSSDDGNIGKNRVDADLINWDFHCASWRKVNMLGASFFGRDNYPVYSGTSVHLFPRYFAMMDSPKRDQSINIILGFREDDYQRMLEQNLMHKYRSNLR